jgi:hypothetical protein
MMQSCRIADVEENLHPNSSTVPSHPAVQTVQQRTVRQRVSMKAARSLSRNVAASALTKYHKSPQLCTSWKLRPYFFFSKSLLTSKFQIVSSRKVKGMMDNSEEV